MTFFNILRRQIAPVGLAVSSNINNLHRRFMSRLRKYFSYDWIQNRFANVGTISTNIHADGTFTFDFVPALDSFILSFPNQWNFRKLICIRLNNINLKFHGLI